MGKDSLGEKQRILGYQHFFFFPPQNKYMLDLSADYSLKALNLELRFEARGA